MKLAPWLCMFACATAAAADADPPIRAAARHDISIGNTRSASAPVATHSVVLTLAYVAGSGWTTRRITEAAHAAAAVIAQCGVLMTRAEIVRIAAPETYRDFTTASARVLTSRLPLPRPAIYFVRDTRQEPAFEAEAFGMGNSRTRPELAGTAWVTLGARDLDLLLAHELSHVLMDSGEHAEAADNLMREDTARESVRLTDVQCARMRDEGTKNGWLTLRP